MLYFNLMWCCCFWIDERWWEISLFFIGICFSRKGSKETMAYALKSAKQLRADEGPEQIHKIRITHLAWVIILVLIYDIIEFFWSYMLVSGFSLFLILIYLIGLVSCSMCFEMNLFCNCYTDMTHLAFYYWMLSVLVFLMPCMLVSVFAMIFSVWVLTFESVLLLNWFCLVFMWEFKPV